MKWWRQGSDESYSIELENNIKDAQYTFLYRNFDSFISINKPVACAFIVVDCKHHSREILVSRNRYKQVDLISNLRTNHYKILDRKSKFLSSLY